MSKKLIIAEKPSVAADIARALGGFTRKSDYFESDDFVLSSAVGHLLELVLPEEYDVKKGKWSFAKLPVIPPHFDLSPIERNQQRLNGTRAMTAFNSKEGGFYLTTVGRVQTPTLAILVEREDKIRAFTARDYWEVHARFAAKTGEYAGRWFDPRFKKDDDAERKPERLWTAKEARAIVAACRSKKGTATE